MQSSDIVHLNVGGQRFSTSKRTLLSLEGEETFFSSLLSGRISSNVDETGAYFIDRDPTLFKLILNYLRTQHLKQLVDECSSEPSKLSALIHEAKFYGITPLAKQLSLCNDVGKSTGKCGNILFCGSIAPPETSEKQKVRHIKTHNSTLVIAFESYFASYHLTSVGYKREFTSSPIKGTIEGLAINGRMAIKHEGRHEEVNKIVAVSHDNVVSIIGHSNGKEYLFGDFTLPTDIIGLFFVGNELIALSQNHIGVWRSQHWQSQRVAPITSYDVGGESFLFFGSANGSIYYIDMEKFPLRMKDNDLLISEIFREFTPKTAITALSVFLPPKTKSCHGNSVEIAYGTSIGLVRVIVQYPETVGQGPQLYQTYTMHTSPIVDILLSEKSLLSVCANQHVRTWSVTRFRGMISTYPGSTVLSSFSLMDLDKLNQSLQSEPMNELNCRPKMRTNGSGPDDEALLFQKLAPTEILLRQASNGDRVAEIHSVDGSPFVAYWEHECDNSTYRSTSGISNTLFTGHENGVVQMWDLATASVMFKKKGSKIESTGSLQSHEMARLIDTTRHLEL